MGQVRTYDICKELSLTKIFWTINVMLSWLEFFQLLQEYPSQTCRDSKSLKKITGILMQVLQLPQFSPVFTRAHWDFPPLFPGGLAFLVPPLLAAAGVDQAQGLSHLGFHRRPPLKPLPGGKTKKPMVILR